MAQKSKVLVIGGTGYIGKFLVEASAKAGHPTFVLSRDVSPSDPEKANLLDGFKSLGVTPVQGDINDHGGLVSAMKQVDIVISTVGKQHVFNQGKIIDAIKEAGNIKRFLPSEFGSDVDNATIVEPALSVYKCKSDLRKTIQAEGIPYTVVVANGFAGVFLKGFGQKDATTPPRDKILIFGDGNAKVIFSKEEDIADYTIKAMGDPRTLNKILYIRPAKNILSFNEIVALWEGKIGKTIEKTYLPEELLLKKIESSPMPINMYMSLAYSIFIKGDGANYDIDPAVGVEATELYPEVKYTSNDEYLNQFV